MFELIRTNKLKSYILIAVFNLILVAIGACMGYYLLPLNSAESAGIGIGIALIVWGILMMVSFSSGEQLLLGTAGAYEVTKIESPQLFNVVEEMKIASGLTSMPKIYIIDSDIPNAFAVGRTEARSAVAVTSGLLAKLDREELQGVIAHEMAHIINRDTLFMTLAGVYVGVIIIIADFFVRRVWGRGRGDSKLAIPLLVLSLVFALLAPLLAKLLYFACSRRREYCADASAVQFTRYPDGLASALRKISQHQSRLLSDSRVLAPMFIVNPLAAQGSSNGLFSTHPSTADRIQVLRGITKSSSLAAYESSYRRIHKSDKLLGRRSLSASVDLPLLSVADVEQHHTAIEQRRLSPIMSQQSAMPAAPVKNVNMVACTCGLIFRIPQNETSVACARCGKTHSR